jgi:hypothetical protein
MLPNIGRSFELGEESARTRDQPLNDIRIAANSHLKLWVAEKVVKHCCTVFDYVSGFKWRFCLGAVPHVPFMLYDAAPLRRLP